MKIFALLLIAALTASAQVQEEPKKIQVVVSAWGSGPLAGYLPIPNSDPSRQGLLVSIRSADPGVTAYRVTVRFVREDGTTGVVSRITSRNDSTSVGWSNEAFVLGPVKPSGVVVEDLRTVAAQAIDLTADR